MKRDGSRRSAASAPFYPTWYPSRWLGRGACPAAYGEFGKLAKHLRFAERHTRQARARDLPRDGALRPEARAAADGAVPRVDIGAELFAMAAACVRARMLAKEGNREAIELADLFCREARQRIETNFARFYGKHDGAIYRVAQQVLARRARVAGGGHRRPADRRRASAERLEGQHSDPGAPTGGRRWSGVKAAGAGAGCAGARMRIGLGKLLPPEAVSHYLTRALAR